jgi:hypothetical protein
MARSVARGEWAVLWVSLQNCDVHQLGKMDLLSELGEPLKVDAWLVAVD